MEGVKFASEMAANTNRRALRDIKNIIGAPHQHLAVRKRGLLEKRAAVDPKNQPRFAGHLHVTRKFAVTLATQPTSSPLDLCFRIAQWMGTKSSWCCSRQSHSRTGCIWAAMGGVRKDNICQLLFGEGCKARGMASLARGFCTQDSVLWGV